MNKGNMWIWIAVAFLVGAFAGYSYEKTKFVKLSEMQRVNMQQQIDNLKMGMGKGGVVTMAKNSKLGVYATGANGMALYVYDKDSKDQSNCTGDCAQKWPPYTAAGPGPSPAPGEHLGTIQRADGTTQYTWDGKPLYYYSSDKDKEDVYGDGIGGVWHVAK